MGITLCYVTSTAHCTAQHTDYDMSSGKGQKAGKQISTEILVEPLICGRMASHQKSLSGYTIREGMN